jgi:thiol:disulfide interchange protein
MMTYYLYRAIDWLNPLVHLIGFGIAAWAFRQCRKRGYLVIAIYFALASATLLGMPSINRMIAQRRAPDISEATKQKMNQAMHEAMERVLAEAGNPPIAADMTINFPFGPILLVTGLWLIARKERTTEPSARPYGSPEAGSPSGQP